MTRYYFSLNNGVVLPDHNGKQLATVEEARSVAVGYACQMLRSLSEPWLGQVSTLQVADAQGAILFTLAFCASDTLAEAA